MDLLIEILEEVTSMKRAYEEPKMSFVPFNHKDRIAGSAGPGPVCYPIYSNIDTTTPQDYICDTTPVYVGRNNT